MRKRTVALLLIFVLLTACLASCVTSTPNDSSADASSSNESVPAEASSASGEVSDEANPSEDPGEVSNEVSEPYVRPVFETEQVPASSVRHVFTHCLINDPVLGCSTAYGPLDTDCLTVKEFKALLQSLYDKGFCLINIHDMYVVEADGKAHLADTVTVNKGKKPLVISIDDVTYDPRKAGSGMIDRLVIENGTIMGCYDNPDGTTTLTDGEVFPIVEQFVREHPDFSYDGNKVTLALTGFAGILGYRTDEDEFGSTYDVAEERRKAQIVVDWLLDNGYNFACHSWGHGHFKNYSAASAKSDMEKWKRNVTPLIGETKVFVYPYGDFTLYGTGAHSALVDAGFVVFCGTSQLNALWDGRHPKDGGTASNTGSIYLERFTVDGRVLRIYGSRKTYIDYYTKYFMSVYGDSQEVAYADAVKMCDRRYADYRGNCLEYFVPEEIYDHENRYFKILPDDVASE